MERGSWVTPRFHCMSFPPPTPECEAKGMRDLLLPRMHATNITDCIFPPGVSSFFPIPRWLMRALLMERVFPFRLPPRLSRAHFLLSFACHLPPSNTSRSGIRMVSVLAPQRRIPKGRESMDVEACGPSG